MTKRIPIIVAWLSVAAFAGEQVARAEEPSKADTPLVKAWTFRPEKPARYTVDSGKAGDKATAKIIFVGRKGEAKELFAEAASFYAKQCGSDRDPVKKRAVGDSGESKDKGRYLITEPEFSEDLKELLFVYTSEGGAVTVLLQRQSADMVRIVLTVTER